MYDAGRVILVFGRSFTGKTTFALGTEKDDIVDYYEFERGGWRRASIGVPYPERIRVHSYRTPLTDLESEGEVVMSAKGGTGSRPVQALQGWEELYLDFKAEFKKNLENGPGRPVIDTGTRLWLLVSSAWNQQLQNATGNTLASLDQLKFTAANIRMNQILDAAERVDKTLIVISHEERDFKTEAIQADGYKHLPGLADFTLRFTIEDKRPVATFWKSGEAGQDVQEMTMKEPTMERVHRVLDCAAALRRAGLPMPGSVEEIIEQGEMVGG